MRKLKTACCMVLITTACGRSKSSRELENRKKELEAKEISLIKASASATSVVWEIKDRDTRPNDISFRLKQPVDGLTCVSNSNCIPDKVSNDFLLTVSVTHDTDLDLIFDLSACNTERFAIVATCEKDQVTKKVRLFGPENAKP